MTTRADHHGDGSPPADLVQTSALSANPRVLTGLNRTSANNYGALTPRKPPNQVIESAHGGGQELHTCCAAAHNDPPTHPIITPPVRGVCEKKTSLFSLPDHLRLCLAFPSEPRPPQPHHVLTPHLLWTLSSHRPIGTGQPSVPRCDVSLKQKNRGADLQCLENAILSTKCQWMSVLLLQWCLKVLGLIP